MGGDGKGPEHLALKPMYVDSAYLSSNRSDVHSYSDAEFANLLPANTSFQKNPANIPISRRKFSKSSAANRSSIHSDWIRMPANNSKPEETDFYKESPRNTRPKSLVLNAFDWLISYHSLCLIVPVVSINHIQFI